MTEEATTGVGTRTESRRRGRPSTAQAAGISRDERKEWIKSVDIATLDTPGLPEVPPLEGMEQRWIRIKAGSEMDTANLVRAEARGWRPRSAESVSKAHRNLKLKDGDFAGCIGYHDVVLMHRPVEIGKQVREIEAQKVRDKDLAVKSIQFRETEGLSQQHWQNERPELKSRVETGVRSVEIPD